MDILYLLIPLSALLVLLILAVFAWALHRGQFEDLDREGRRILDEDGTEFEARQEADPGIPEQSAANPEVPIARRS